MATNGDDVPSNLLWTWAQQRIWSRVADDLKRGLDRARTGALVLAVVAAVLAVASVQATVPVPGSGPFLSAAAAVGAGAATALQRRVGTEQVRTWTVARSVAEGLKSEVYSYLAGGSAYAGDDDRERALGVNARRILEDVDALRRHAIGVAPDDKPLPDVSDLAGYLTQRVGGQIEDYYRPRAAFYDRRVRRLRGLSVAMGALTVVLSAVATSFGTPAVAAWVPVATTASTSLAAHIAASRYDHLVVEYLRTAQTLEHLRDTYLDSPGRAHELVDACENAISIENQGWMARWRTGADRTAGENPGP